MLRDKIEKRKNKSRKELKKQKKSIISDIKIK
jgi:hypothetical protein